MSGTTVNSKAPAVSRPLWAAPAAVPGKVWRRLKRWCRHRFQNRNHVFAHHGPFEPVPNPTCRVVRYDRYDDIPEEVRAGIRRHRDRTAVDKDRFEMEQKAALWVAFIDSEPAGLLFGRRGGAFRTWFVPLRNKDIVLFRGVTFPPYRGRGVMPTLTRTAMHDCLSPGDTAYCDCRVYNTASMRCIEKAGFTHIATMRAIRRRHALGTADAVRDRQRRAP
jgi:RimJ/RimL family protein N-acetyltransferase